MSGFKWLFFIPVLFVVRKPVALLNTYHLNPIRPNGVNKFRYAFHQPQAV